MMKILSVCCSPREGKNTETLLQEVLRGANKEGAQAEFYSVIGKDINPCRACGSCNKTGKCQIDDDMQALYRKMKESDGIVLGSPVYFFDVTAQAKTIIDRTYALKPLGEPLANKVGGIVVSAGSTGTADAIKNLHMFFGIHRVLVVNWVAVFGSVEDKPTGLKAAYNLGREMVQTARYEPHYSAEFRPNHVTFGTHTF